MGLTFNSTGFKTVGIKELKKTRPSDIVVALSGNPNVGKSTVFNSLTGLHQHTGNWTGKTVTSAAGHYIHNGRRIILVDLPGTYSLFSLSEEERVTERYLAFGNADVNVVVCDALSLERNLNLLLQITEISPKTVLCINLIDEALKNGIEIDTEKLSLKLGIPVIATVARSGKGLTELSDAIISVADFPPKSPLHPQYDDKTEEKIEEICKALPENAPLSKRFTAIKILEKDSNFFDNYTMNFGVSLPKTNSKCSTECIVSGIMKTAEDTLKGCIKKSSKKRKFTDLKIDRVITSKRFGIPLMLLLLGIIFWITIVGANYPSQWLSNFFTSLEKPFFAFLIDTGLPKKICQLLVFGIFRVVAWIVSVMLPPMAIFFPLFTLLEDLGYLPRLAFNLDKCFQKCRTCGKQALTMCMGFGCNAAGVVGCRIINSPRERLIAVLTNSFVPCNGRFPTLITVITIFIVGLGGGILNNFLATVLLCLFVLLGIFMTFLVSNLLSKTLLRGVSSSFTLELPPYRHPQIIKVIVRSVFDRTLFVLSRAIIAAVPAGLIIWLMSNITVGGTSLLNTASQFLDPIGQILGLDGVILIAFILGFPANEIVLPIIIMAYSGGSVLTDVTNLAFIKDLLLQNGWNLITAINLILFSLFHWPCATTVMTVRKETGSIKWAVLSIVLPTAVGIILCIFTNLLFNVII